MYYRISKDIIKRAHQLFAFSQSLGNKNLRPEINKTNMHLVHVCLIPLALYIYLTYIFSNDCGDN